LPADFTALSERNIERFGSDYFVIHLSDGLGRLIRRRKTDEAKPLRRPLLIAHDLAACNCAEWLKLSTKLLVIDVVLEVLDVKVHALILAHLLLFRGFIRLSQFIFALCLLLSARNEKLLALELKIVKGLHGGLSLIMGLEIDEAETFAPTLVIELYDSRGNCAVSLEQLNELVLRDLQVDIFDV
jgi:hypothetical protein